MSIEQLDLIDDTLLAPDHPPRSDRLRTRIGAALKKRRLRARRKAGLRVLRIEVDECALSSALIAAGLLRPLDGENIPAIERAVTLLVEAAIGDA